MDDQFFILVRDNSQSKWQTISVKPWKNKKGGQFEKPTDDVKAVLNAHGPDNIMVVKVVPSEVLKKTEVLGIKIGD